LRVDAILDLAVRTAQEYAPRSVAGPRDVHAMTRIVAARPVRN